MTASSMLRPATETAPQWRTVRTHCPHTSTERPVNNNVRRVVPRSRPWLVTTASARPAVAAALRESRFRQRRRSTKRQLPALRPGPPPRSGARPRGWRSRLCWSRNSNRHPTKARLILQRLPPRLVPVGVPSSSTKSMGCGSGMVASLSTDPEVFQIEGALVGWTKTTMPARRRDSERRKSPGAREATP